MLKAGAVLLILCLILPGIARGEEAKAFPTHWQYLLSQRQVDPAIRADQQLIDRLIQRMGDCAVFCSGSNEALYRGNMARLNPADYTAQALMTPDQVLVPGTFLSAFFSQAGTDGLVDLLALCEGSSDYSVLRTSALGKELAILTPAGCAGFSDEAATDGTYTNAQYINRMAVFFTEGQNVPSGKNNVAATRTVLATHEYPEDAVNYETQAYVTGYSPAIQTVIEGGEPVLYAMYEPTKVKNFAESGATLMLYRSRDRGVTWEYVTEKPFTHFACPFVFENQLYIYAHDLLTQGPFLARLEGDTFGKPVHLFIRSDDPLTLGGAAGNVVIKDGKIFLPVGRGNVIWASTEEDFMRRKAWHYIYSGVITESWYKQCTGVAKMDRFTSLEGNVIQGPDGALYVINRVCAYPSGTVNGYAALCRIKDDLSGMERAQACDGLVEMPTGRSRFMVTYDEKTGLYISFTSMPVLEVDWPTMQRNVLAMTVSENLVDWEVVDIILSDRAMMNPYVSSFAHGFNYVDWTVAGDDIVLIVREATGEHVNTFHDGTYVTTYRIADYVDFIAQRRTGEIYHYDRE